MKIKIKKLHPSAKIPFYAKHGDAGMDLTATSKTTDKIGNVVYGTGLAFEIPKGYVGYIFPRSSNSETDLLLTNSVGVVDSGYRGEVKLKYGQYRSTGNDYSVGDRVGQIIIMPHPAIQFEECDELSESERGAGGYGSTGK